MSLNDIKNMPINQRVELMKLLWQSFCIETTPPNSPSWHKDILNKRVKELKSQKLYDLNELKALR